MANSQNRFGISDSAQINLMPLFFQVRRPIPAADLFPPMASLGVAMADQFCNFAFSYVFFRLCFRALFGYRSIILPKMAKKKSSLAKGEKASYSRWKTERASDYRIQTLLFTEYSDLEDIVLIESPFAQTTRDGVGIRQIQMGLTPSKLILAGDVLCRGRGVCNPWHRCCLNPDWGSLELILVCPVECVNMSVFRRRSRYTLKAHFCNNRVLYFELATSFMRDKYWNLWCERVKYLCPEEGKSTQSETSVGSSTSASTLHRCRCESTPYVNLLHSPSIKSSRDLQTPAQPKVPAGNGDSNRQDSGPTIEEECVLLWEHQRGSGKTLERHKRRYGLAPRPHLLLGLGPWKLPRHEASTLQAKKVSSNVTLWPTHQDPEFRLNLSRRQLVSTWSCHCLQPCSADKSTAESASQRRKRTLSQCNRFFAPQRPAFLFWTPEYWYRPVSQKYVYQVVMSRLRSVRSYLDRMSAEGTAAFLPEEQDTPERPRLQPAPLLPKKRLRLPWTLRKKKSNFSKCSSSCTVACSVPGDAGSSTHDLYEAGGDAVGEKKKVHVEMCEMNPIVILKSMLKSDAVHTSWDFDSTQIAYQLTIIDRDLFKKITKNDLEVLLKEGNSRNAPNLGALIAFSHRTANLVATEITNTESVKMRARMISRYINAVDKLNRLRNMQSAASLLYGLQSSPVFRLKQTWHYLRRRHSIKYQRLCQLMKLYNDPRTIKYNRMVDRATRTPPYLPSVAYLVSALLARLPQTNCTVPSPSVRSGGTSSFSMIVCETVNSQMAVEGYPGCPVPRPLRQFVSSFGALGTSLSCESTYSESTTNSWASEASGTSVAIPSQELSKYFVPVRDDELTPAERLASLSAQLVSWQRAADKYALPANRQAFEFFTLSQYRQEWDNFQISLKIEPPLSELSPV